MRRLRYVLCDVFTDRPLTGNALAVFTGADGLAPATMQAIAREMNLSESIFLMKGPSTRAAHMVARIFTPNAELPFAGHPVLGAAFVIGETVQLDQVRIETGRGVVPVNLTREGPRPTFGWMTQPMPGVAVFPDVAPLLEALGVAEAALPVELYDNGPRHVMVCVSSPAAVSRLKPDIRRLAEWPLAFSVFGGREGEYRTRVFCPGLDVVEDPATGSAAGPLALHLVRHGRADFGDELRIEQGESIGRPSVLYARVAGEGDRVTGVEVGGAAVIVGRGELVLAV